MAAIALGAGLFSRLSEQVPTPPPAADLNVARVGDPAVYERMRRESCARLDDEWSRAITRANAGSGDRNVLFAYAAYADSLMRSRGCA